ncbi:MAG: hypothetical protein ACLVKO_08945 [Dysgonomonas sp.]
MKNLNISYNKKGTSYILSLIVAAYAVIMGAYITITQLLVPSYSFLFFFGLLLFLLSVALILILTLGQPKPLVLLNSESLTVNSPDKVQTVVNWNDVSNVGLGLSYFKFKKHDGSEITAELSFLKYSDLKIMKSNIIEICESKNISFQND